MKPLKSYTLTGGYSNNPKDIARDVKTVIDKALKLWPDDEQERKKQVCEWCCYQKHMALVAEQVWNRLEYMLPEEEKRKENVENNVKKNL